MSECRDSGTSVPKVPPRTSWNLKQRTQWSLHTRRGRPRRIEPLGLVPSSPGPTSWSVVRPYIFSIFVTATRARRLKRPDVSRFRHLRTVGSRCKVSYDVPSRRSCLDSFCQEGSRLRIIPVPSPYPERLLESWYFDDHSLYSDPLDVYFLRTYSLSDTPDSTHFGVRPRRVSEYRNPCDHTDLPPYTSVPSNKTSEF